MKTYVWLQGTMTSDVTILRIHSSRLHWKSPHPSHPRILIHLSLSCPGLGLEENIYVWKYTDVYSIPPSISIPLLTKQNPLIRAHLIHPIPFQPSIQSEKKKNKLRHIFVPIAGDAPRQFVAEKTNFAVRIFQRFRCVVSVTAPSSSSKKKTKTRKTIH